MATNERNLFYCGTLPDESWKRLLTCSEFDLLKQSNVLEPVPLVDLIGSTGIFDLPDLPVTEYEVVEVNNRVGLLPLNLSAKFHEIKSETVIFSRLNLESLAEKIDAVNQLKLMNPRFSVPAFIKYLGYKSVNDYKTVHFLLVSNVTENQIHELASFFVHTEDENTYFVLISETPLVLMHHFGPRFGKKVSFAKLPIDTKFKVADSLVFRADFGYTVDQIVEGSSEESLIVDKQGNAIFFGRQKIINGSTQEFKILEHLADHPDQFISNDHIAQHFLGRPAYESSSDPVRKIKHKIIKKAAGSTGEGGRIHEVFKRSLSENANGITGGITLNTKEISIIIVKSSLEATPKV